MGSLIVHCPKTCEVINTGIRTEYRDLAQQWDKTIRVCCPHCNDEHDVKVRDAYVRGAVSQFRLRGE